MCSVRVYTAGVVGSIPAGPTTDRTAARHRPGTGRLRPMGQGERTVGVEEELLLVDVSTGRPRSVAGQVIGAVSGDQPDDVGREGGVEGELQRYMVETQSSVCTDLADVERELRDWRHTVSVAAREAGAGSAALATSPLPGDGLITPKARYLQMAEQFGPTAQEVLTCGSHVHVGIGSPEEGIAVIDRIRGWLPVVLALSANSPFSDGRDTGYASYRSQLWVRWPSAGPTDVFGTPAAYEALVASMVDSGVLLDDGMVYFDARLSHRYPTVEIRVADVCARPLRHDGRRRRLPGAGRDRRPGGGPGRAATTGAHGAPSAGHLARRSRRSGRGPGRPGHVPAGAGRGGRAAVARPHPAGAGGVR